MTPEIATRADWGVFSRKQILQNLFGAGWRQADKPVFNPQPRDFGSNRMQCWGDPFCMPHPVIATSHHPDCPWERR